MLHRLYISILMLTLLLPYIRGQEIILVDDTVSLGEVRVEASVPDGMNGFRIKKIDKNAISRTSAQSLASLIGRSTSFYVKNYGAGGLATTSFRGMGANHTQVSWEGLPLNNPMLGQSDFSVIPVSFIDNIEIYPGASPGAFGNNGAGGTIIMSSEPDWIKKKPYITFAQMIGSFGSLSENITLSASSDRIIYRVKSYFNQSKNNYPYTDYFSSVEPQVKRRTGAEYIAGGVLQELFYKNNNSVLSGKMWYSKNYRQLPASILSISDPGNESQLDETVKVMLNSKFYGKDIRLDCRLAYTSDWLEYNNRLSEINSRNFVQGYFAFAKASWRPLVNMKLDMKLSSHTNMVSSNNYDKRVVRIINNADIYYSVLLAERVGLFASVSLAMADKDILPLSPAAGFDIKVAEKRNIHLKGSAAFSHKLPTLNDLYWVPGGNPDLKPENTSVGEISMSYSDNIGMNILYTGDVTGYYSSINQMIMWTPVSASVWTPENISRVVSSGIETDHSFKAIIDRHMIGLSVSYSYNNAVQVKDDSSENDLSLGKQLIYVPRNMASASMVYERAGINIEWNTAYTGKRFISSDNIEYLHAYLINNLMLSQTINFKKAGLRIGIDVNNIFNNEYENVLNYPMPGRSFQLVLSISTLTNEKTL